MNELLKKTEGGAPHCRPLWLCGVLRRERTAEECPSHGHLHQQQGRVPVQGHTPVSRRVELDDKKTLMEESIRGDY